ncbi:MAG TPA: anthranilate phosphoribosyltransferase [Verrucomicrobiae bacterium]|jgi:anthranilate phosphoribosyltransferase|nr:anthranilate phosphoribosyltransferase [Verrucomicrobiae bacterium]
MDFEPVLEKLLRQEALTEGESFGAFVGLFKGSLSPAQSKALLLLLARKGETRDELQGCVRALRKLEPPRRVRIAGLLDTCGTGGDGSRSINVSTLAAFVIAGAGGKVAKHGNRAITSACGSSDLMEWLGVKLEAPPEVMIRALRRSGLGYFHAPYYHPVFSRAQALRKKLKVRTLFNLLGPLMNPLEVEGQVIGVSRPEFIAPFAHVLRKRGVRCAMVCHSADGLDEISTGAPTDYVLIRGEKTAAGRINPRKLGLRRYPRQAFITRSAAASRKAALGILTGKVKGAMKDIVVLNAAAGIWIAGLAPDLNAGMEAARESLEAGRAYEVLIKLKKMTRSRSFA